MKAHANPSQHGFRAVEYSPRECGCGHDLSDHHKSVCTKVIEESGMPCGCVVYRPVKRTK